AFVRRPAKLLKKSGGQSIFHRRPLDRRLRRTRPATLGGESSRPVGGDAGESRSRVSFPELFPAREAGAGNSPRARADSAARRMFEPGPDRRRRGTGRGRRSRARSLFIAWRGAEGVSFYAGTGRGSERSRLLAPRDRR